MRRITIEPRPNWQTEVEKYGFLFHTLRGEPYWDEGACYQFTTAQIDTLQKATEALHEMCLGLVQHVIDKRLFDRFLIPPEFVDYVVGSWEEREPSVYGRFDLAYDGEGPPKLLEYNADTPTGLLEAAVVQWNWVKGIDPQHGDQFNLIHDDLIAAWKAVHERDPGPIHFVQLGNLDTPEDFITAEYMRDVATQAGFRTAHLDVEQIGWDDGQKAFVDHTGFPIHRCFKLYPWEWMVREEYSAHVLEATTKWVEPGWKMLLSCKSILPLLHELHPDSPYLLPASFEPLPTGSFVRKPVHAREGANIQVTIDGQLVLDTEGPYTEGPHVYQALAPLKPHDGRYPVIGSWVVNGLSSGLGIREDSAMVTRNTSRFVPHRIVE